MDHCRGDGCDKTQAYAQVGVLSDLSAGREQLILPASAVRQGDSDWEIGSVFSSSDSDGVFIY